MSTNRTEMSGVPMMLETDRKKRERLTISIPDVGEMLIVAGRAHRGALASVYRAPRVRIVIEWDASPGGGEEG